MEKTYYSALSALIQAENAGECDERLKQLSAECDSLNPHPGPTPTMKEIMKMIFSSDPIPALARRQ